MSNEQGNDSVNLSSGYAPESPAQVQEGFNETPTKPSRTEEEIKALDELNRLRSSTGDEDITDEERRKLEELSRRHLDAVSKRFIANRQGSPDSPPN